MSVIGFNFTKIVVEKHQAKAGKVEISNNVGIKKIEESNLKLSTDDKKVLKFDFEFESKYNPDLGSIKLEGNLLNMIPAKDGDEVLKEWKDSKKISHEVMKGVMNTILSKANVQALILSRDVNLPSPIPLPKVNVKK